MSIRLITFSGQTVTPKTDGIIQDASIGQNGIFYGCGVTASGNSLHIDGGYGLIKGRYFEIDATTVPVTLATSDTLLGRLYVKLDLSNTEAPIQMLTATGETLPSLEQDADANFDDGVWEMELATFNITTTEISDLTETYQTITDNASLVSALQTAIDTLNSNIGTTRFTFSSSISGAQGALGYGFKDNATGTVRVYFTARFSSNVGTNTSMFSIPSGYRPSANNGAMCIITTDSNASVAGYATIGADGTIKQGLTNNCRGISGFAEYEV